MSKRVVDETTLRIYFPRHIDTVDTNLPIHSKAEILTSTDHLHLDSVLPQMKTTDSRGLLCFLAIHSPSIYDDYLSLLGLMNYV